MHPSWGQYIQRCCQNDEKAEYLCATRPQICRHSLERRWTCRYWAGAVTPQCCEACRAPTTFHQWEYHEQPRRQLGEQNESAGRPCISSRRVVYRLWASKKRHSRQLLHLRQTKKSPVQSLEDKIADSNEVEEATNRCLTAWLLHRFFHHAWVSSWETRRQRTQCYPCGSPTWR